MIILVTGATGGFGQILTATLCDAGHTVYGTSRNPENSNANVPLLALDIASQLSANACVDAVVVFENCFVLSNGVIILGVNTHYLRECREHSHVLRGWNSFCAVDSPRTAIRSAGS